jgi:hypothetical protein
MSVWRAATTSGARNSGFLLTVALQSGLGRHVRTLRVRVVAHNNETDTWPLLAKSASGYVSSFGDLTGLSLGNSSQKKLELMPYALAQVATSPVREGNPLTKSPDPSASVGLDLKAKIGAGLTLTGTINPDFGQVEADPAVVNLSGFETPFSSAGRSSSKGPATSTSTWIATTATARACSIRAGLDARRMCS